MSSQLDRLRSAMYEALRGGEFISYGASWDFVYKLEEVSARVKGLVGKGRAVAAVSLYEDFIAASYDKAEEIDDSGGNLGDFIQELVCDWVSARQAAAAAPEETVGQLLRWIEDDEYGFYYRIEREVVKVLDTPGLDAFAAQARSVLDATAPTTRGSAGSPRRHWTEILKHILTARADAEGYLTLFGASVPGPADCDVLAGIHEARGEFEEALAWVERGLALVHRAPLGSSAGYELERRQRDLLARLGRAEEAVAAPPK